MRTIAAAGVLALVAACTSTPRAPDPSSSSGGASSSTASTVAYAACMRSHGVPNYPDPDSSGTLPKGDAQSFGVSGAQLQDAQRACQSLLPTGGPVQDQARQCTLTGDCPQALVQQMVSGGRIVARCMRAHGVPNWPDPTISANGGPYFDLSGSGLTRAYTHSAQIERIAGQCGRQPGAVGLPMG